MPSTDRKIKLEVPQGILAEIRNVTGWYFNRDFPGDDASEWMYGILLRVLNCVPTVACSVCGELIQAETAHSREGGWIGDECCWDGSK